VVIRSAAPRRDQVVAGGRPTVYNLITT